MANPTAEELAAFTRWPAAYLGEPWFVGPVANRQGGTAIAADLATLEQYVVTSTGSGTGVGTWNWAVSQVNTANGIGYIRVSVSGTIDTSVNPIDFLNPQKVVVDARGQDCRISGVGLGFSDNAAIALDYLCLLNFRITSLTGHGSPPAEGEDGINHYINQGSIGALFRANVHIDIDPSDVDEYIDVVLNAPVTGMDVTVVGCQMSRTAAINSLGELYWASTGDGANFDKIRILTIDNFWNNITNRSPLIGGDGVATPGVLSWSLNNYYLIRQSGYRTRQQVKGWSENDTIDGSVTNLGWENAKVEGDADSTMKVTNVRVINLPGFTGYTERNVGSAVDWRTYYSDIVLRTPSAAQDALVQRRATHWLQATCGGTLHNGDAGTNEDAVNGKTWTVTLPSTQAWKTPFTNADRATWVDRVFGVTGLDLFTDPAVDIVRTSDQTITATVSAASLSIDVDAQMYWAGGDEGLIQSGDYLGTWNPTRIFSVAAGPPPPPIALARRASSRATRARRVWV